MKLEEHAGQARPNQASKSKRPRDVVETMGIPSKAKLSILKAWKADMQWR
jgi:hypothetical protein